MWPIACLHERRRRKPARHLPQPSCVTCAGNTAEQLQQPLALVLWEQDGRCPQQRWWVRGLAARPWAQQQRCKQGIGKPVLLEAGRLGKEALDNHDMPMLLSPSLSRLGLLCTEPPLAID